VGDDPCPLCALVEALRTAEMAADPVSGGAYWKIRDFPHSVAVLAPDQFYRGYALVIARVHARELYELPDAEGTGYYREMLAVARAIAVALAPRKLNYELLGNTVPHLHWHLFPRHADDPRPARPTWEHPHAPRILAPGDSAALVTAIRGALA
jgi:diadenosine tetraphosphate (Ap4A) HIT family hydrolase